MFGEGSVGYGFVAEGYFITDAHVIEDFSPCFVYIDGKWIELSKETPIFIGSGRQTNADDIDLAVYKFETLHDGLQISEDTPKITDILESCCVKEVQNKNIVELNVEPAYPLGEEQGNYFFCKCKRYKGSSGSPLLKDKKVIGVMNAGEIVKTLSDNGNFSEEEKEKHGLKDDDIICSFLKISVFKALIDKIENK